MYVSVSERFVKCAEYLIETRKLRNQAELVRLLGLSKGYVSQLMSGKREPSETIVSNLCAELDVPDPTISLGMGHRIAGHRTTAIYIKRDQRKVDEANRKVIDYLKGTVPHLTT